MKRILLAEPRKFVFDEVETPRPGPGQALVRIKKVGVCGSDIHLYRDGNIGAIRMDRPLVIGHECVGDVVEAGDEEGRELVGKRVAVEPQLFCGRCEWCVSGMQNVCPNHTFLGLPPKDGGLQEYLVHPAHLLAPLPATVSYDGGVVLEPMAVALHAISLVKVKPGETVVILGVGVLGSCVLMALGLYKGLRVIAVDVLPDRLERARKLGAEHTILAAPGDRSDVVARVAAITGRRGAGIVVEAAGTDETMWNMCEVAGPGGHVAVIGTNPRDVVAMSSTSVRRKGLTLRFVRRSLNTLPDCIALSGKGALDPAALVTHTFAARDVEKAFVTVDKHADGVLKAVVDMEKW